MSEYLTLTRQQFYELVWSKPMSELAKDFGLTDVALAKRCRRLNIPVPGRGYWARVAAGQAPVQVKLPDQDEDDDSIDRRALHFSEPLSRPEDPAIDAAGWIQKLSALSVAPVTRLEDCHVVIRRTALAAKHASASDLKFGRGEKSGVVMPIDVTAPLLERALFLADTLLRSGNELGWTLHAPQPPKDEEQSSHHRGQPALPAPTTPRFVTGAFVILGERIRFCIEERRRAEAREPTAAELVREKREYRYHPGGHPNSPSDGHPKIPHP